MQRIRAKLTVSIAGPGFVIKNGYHLGEIDEFGIVWIAVMPTNRIPGERATEKRVGVHASKFSFLENPDAPADNGIIAKRAEVNAKIRAAEEQAKYNAANTGNLKRA